MREVVLGPMDDSVTLRDGETLEDTRIRALGSWLGRVLFAERYPLVHIIGRNVTVRRCILECQGEDSTAVRVRR